jgi:predicted dithiol-disulfide oxidoreductase (DUF899 family)
MARPRGCGSPRPRARPARRSSTRSTAPLATLPSASTLPWSPKSDPERIRTFAGERGWCYLRLLSSRNNTYNRDYHAETPEGEQVPILNVFVRDGRLRHSWATELMFAPRDEGEDPRHVESIWPIWSVLDMTPGGRGSESDFPRLHYE